MTTTAESALPDFKAPLVESSAKAPPLRKRLTLEERKAAIEARLERQLARVRKIKHEQTEVRAAEAKQARKLETRQKIIIGARFMALFGVTTEAEAQPYFDLLAGSQVPQKLRERMDSATQ